MLQHGMETFLPLVNCASDIKQLNAEIFGHLRDGEICCKYSEIFTT